jgi:tetratricopeptide (TPR) repeat protein
MACGGRLMRTEASKQVLKCEFCQTDNWLFTPQRIRVEKSATRLDSTQRPQFSNLVKILEVAYEAENYREAYAYCNKALEFDADSSDVWTNKALCAFWIILGSNWGENELVSTNALEIRTYLNTAKQADPGNPFYKDAADKIAFNLFVTLRWHLDQLQPDLRTVINAGTKKQAIVYQFSLASLIQTSKYLSTIATCYDIAETKNIDVLKYLVIDYTGHSKILWAERGKGEDADKILPTPAATLARVNPIKEVNLLVSRIREVDPTYRPPPWNVAPKAPPPFNLKPILFILGIIFLVLLASNC